MRKIPFIVLLLLAIMAKCSADVWEIKAKDYNDKWYTQTITKQEYAELYTKYKTKVQTIEGDFTLLVPRCHKATHVELSTLNLNVKRAKLIHYYQEPKK